jgi:hypothetical protein
MFDFDCHSPLCWEAEMREAVRTISKDLKVKQREGREERRERLVLLHLKAFDLKKFIDINFDLLRGNARSLFRVGSSMAMARGGIRIGNILKREHRLDGLVDRISHALNFSSSQVRNEIVHDRTLRSFGEHNLSDQLDHTSHTEQPLPIQSSLKTSQHREVDEEEVQQRHTHPSHCLCKLCHDIRMAETKEEEEEEEEGRIIRQEDQSMGAETYSSSVLVRVSFGKVRESLEVSYHSSRSGGDGDGDGGVRESIDQQYQMKLLKDLKD